MRLGLLMVALFVWMVQAPSAWAQTDEDGDAHNPNFQQELVDGFFLPLMTSPLTNSGGTCPTPVTINFEEAGLDEGDFVTTQIPGVTVSVAGAGNAPNGQPRKAMIFDSACPGGCSGGDGDLITPGYGSGNNVGRRQILIISEDNDQGDPDDNATGGTILLDFDSLVDLINVGMLDMDDGSTSAVLRAFRNGSQVGTLRAVSAARTAGISARGSPSVRSIRPVASCGA